MSLLIPWNTHISKKYCDKKYKYKYKSTNTKVQIEAMVQNIWAFFTSKYIYNQEKVTSKKKVHLPTIVWLSITQKYVSSYLERKIGSCSLFKV